MRLASTGPLRIKLITMFDVKRDMSSYDVCGLRRPVSYVLITMFDVKRDMSSYAVMSYCTWR